MNYQNPELIEELAAQYALGTLRGRARRRFERFYQQDLPALNAVRRWEDRLVELAAGVAPVHPSPQVWRNVQQRLKHGKAKQRDARGWWNRTQWAMAATVAMFTAALAWWILVAVPAPELVATVVDQQQAQLWRIEAPRARDKLHVIASAALTKDEQHAYELWALPKQAGAAPVSLGLMPQTGDRALQLNDAQRLALASAEKVAVSLEPVGGSPTGAPTGPVLFVANVG